MLEFLKSRAFQLVLGLLVVGFLFMVGVYSHAETVFSPISHLDGAFQTASGLHRLLDGQVFGRDFYPYLGVGVTAILFPFYVLHGGTMAASAFSAHFVVTVSVFLSLVLLCRLLFPRGGWTTAGIAGCLLSSWVIYMWQVGDGFIWLDNFVKYGVDVRFFPQLALEPGNSLRPLRSFLPYLAGFFVFFFLGRTWGGRKLAVAFGVLAGFCFLWSNDYGIPVIGLLGFTLLLTLWQRKEPIFVSLFVFGLVFVAAAGVLLTVFTLGHPLAMLAYNFRDVAGDQYWYFPPYTREYRIFTLMDLVWFLLSYGSGWLMVLVGVFVVWLKYPTREHLVLLFVGAGVLGGGVLASVGGHIDAYLFPYTRWAVTVLFLVAGVWVVESLTASLVLRGHSRSHAQYGILAVGVGLTIFFLAQSTNKFFFFEKVRTQSALDQGYFYEPRLGGYLPPDYKVLVDRADAMGSDQVLEEYWGLMSVLLDRHPQGPVDAVIHALGETRLKFLPKEMPEWITTTSLKGSELWGPWGLSTNWWFYRFVFENYEVVEESPVQAFWKKRATPARWESVSAWTTGTGFSIDAPKRGLYEVHVRYKFVGGKRDELLFENRLSLSKTMVDFVAVNPKKTEAIFPVYAEAGVQTYRSYVVAGGKYSLVVESVTSRRISPDFEGLVWKPLSH